MTDKELDFTDPRMLRKKAEEKLTKKQNSQENPALEADVKKLMHELQVHQIELEMQNEELCEAYEAAELALKKYTLLYDFAPMGYFTLNSEASICDLNFTGAEMLGDNRFSLVNSNFKLFISEQSLPVFNDFFRKVYLSNAKESCNVLLGYDKKKLCTVYMEGIVTGDNQQCLLSVVDITGFSKTDTSQ
jgi:hypothetical protein